MADFQDEFWDTLEEELRASRESVDQPAGPTDMEETKPFVWSEPDPTGLTGEEMENAERLTGIVHPATEEPAAAGGGEIPFGGGHGSVLRSCGLVVSWSRGRVVADHSPRRAAAAAAASAARARM